MAGVGIFGRLESRVEVKETCAHIILYETYNNIIIILCTIAKRRVIR